MATKTQKTTVIVRMVRPASGGFGMYQAGESIDMSKHLDCPIETLDDYADAVKEANLGSDVRNDEAAAEAIHGNCYGQDGGTIYAWVIDDGEPTFECASVVEIDAE